jgi:hypothetical protein
MFTVVRPLASVVWAWKFEKRETHGLMALALDREDGVHTHATEGQNSGSREMDAEGTAFIVYLLFARTR